MATRAPSRAVPWLWLSVAAAVLAIAGSVVGLAWPRPYAGLTPAFWPQAIAQDIANLVVASPLVLVSAALALRGSARAYLLWLGALSFTVYNYVIYTFSIPFGPLFLLWVGVLALCTFALIGGLAEVDRTIAQRFAGPRLLTAVGWVLVVAGVLFALLWLSEDVSALLSGTRPASAAELALPTNPVHVLDLAFFLPAVIGIGVQVLRRRPYAVAVAPVPLVFLLLTGVPILITPAVQAANGLPAGWSVALPIGVFTLVVLGLLVWLLATLRRPRTA
ncbi:hypothetical protein GA0111570_1145 [Raineyella antarctica]|uniref:Uncharacterized protein n=1 Tax=Raineyella antarctica TaxID=1577474 RepID=A0A1G6I5A6_9ACTN|nr:hypothetical protein [Raineyella antarctica]SDC00936.1 hypothetical protein GA0111570_1145 [Raineyella antarctica]